ncbi:MAG: pyruvate formate lyase family protein [Bacteroidales bacterium]|nr:pyruvate formate lyase family protein [Bacteroidales bacterium]
MDRNNSTDREEKVMYNLKKELNAVYKEPYSINALNRIKDRKRSINQRNRFNEYANLFSRMINHITDDSNNDKLNTMKWIKGDMLPGNYPKSETSHTMLSYYYNRYFNSSDKEMPIDFFDTANVINYEQLVVNGLQNRIYELELKLDKLIQSNKKGSNQDLINHTESSLTIAKSIIYFADQWSDNLFKQAHDSKNVKEKESLLHLALMCKNVPRNPAINFHQAILSIWIVHLSFMLTGMSPSIGRLDMILNPYIKLETDTCKCINLLESFFLKCSIPYKNNKTYERVYGRLYMTSSKSPKHVPTLYKSLGKKPVTSITLGGKQYIDDRSINNTTLLILKAYAKTKPDNIRLFVRVNKKTRSEVIENVASLISKSDKNITIINDNQQISSSNHTLKLAYANQASKNGVNTDSENSKLAHNFAFDSLGSPTITGKGLRIAKRINTFEILSKYVINYIKSNNDTNTYNSTRYFNNFISPLYDFLNQEMLKSINDLYNKLPNEIELLRHPHVNITNNSSQVVILDFQLEDITQTIDTINVIKKWCYENNSYSIKHIYDIIFDSGDSNNSAYSDISNTPILGCTDSGLDYILGKVTSGFSNIIEIWNKTNNNYGTLKNYRTTIECSFILSPDSSLFKTTHIGHNEKCKSGLGITPILKSLSMIELKNFGGGIGTEYKLTEPFRHPLVIKEFIRAIIQRDGGIIRLYHSEIKGLIKIIHDMSRFIP